MGKCVSMVMMKKEITLKGCKFGKRNHEQQNKPWSDSLINLPRLDVSFRGIFPQSGTKF